jgi:hypothetical protein
MRPRQEDRRQDSPRNNRNPTHRHSGMIGRRSTYSQHRKRTLRRLRCLRVTLSGRGIWSRRRFQTRSCTSLPRISGTRRQSQQSQRRSRICRFRRLWCTSMNRTDTQYTSSGLLQNIFQLHIPCTPSGRRWSTSPPRMPCSSSHPVRRSLRCTYTCLMPHLSSPDMDCRRGRNSYICYR